jgi:hypothetical protein
MRYLFLAIILFVSASCSMHTTVKSFKPCSVNVFSLSYSPLTQKVYFGGVGSGHSRELKVIDPVSLNIEKSYIMNGFCDTVIPINNGLSLLVMLSDIDGDAYTEDGELRQIAYSDGLTENSYPFSTIPTTMVVDSQENFAYITSGIDRNEVIPIISKIDLSTFQKVGNDIVYGLSIDSIAITNDDTKLYVIENVLHKPDPWEDEFYWEIGVFNTSDMSALPPIQLDSPPSALSMGYDNRLYVSFPLPEENHPPLIIIDTLTDTFTEYNYPNHGLDALALDATNRKLYCSVYSEQMDPVFDEIHLAPSPVILEIDLENQYSSREIVLGMEYIWFLDVVPISDPNYNCRLFCRLMEGPDVYYMDVD